MDPDFIEFIVKVGLGLVLLVVGFAAGRVAERRHFASLDAREKELAGIVFSDLRSFPGASRGAKDARLVMGSAVISSDYFKTFVAAIKKFIGGELRTYESLMTRARREAIIRMLEEAKNGGYDAVCNVRLDGFDVGGQDKGKRKAVVSVAVQASGTAYRRG